MPESYVDIRDKNCTLSYIFVSVYLVLSVLIALAAVFLPGIGTIGTATIASVALILFLVALIHLFWSLNNAAKNGKCQCL